MRADGNLSASAEARRAGHANSSPPAATPMVEAPPSAAMTTSRRPASALAVFVSDRLKFVEALGHRALLLLAEGAYGCG